MTALRGLAGSSAIVALAVIFSTWPAAPKPRPCRAEAVRSRTLKRVTSALAGVASARAISPLSRAGWHTMSCLLPRSDAVSRAWRARCGKPHERRVLSGRQLRGRDFVARMKRPIGSSFGCTMGRRAGTISRCASRARFFIGDDVWKTRLNHCPTSAVAHNTTSREGQLWRKAVIRQRQQFGGQSMDGIKRSFLALCSLRTNDARFPSRLPSCWVDIFGLRPQVRRSTRLGSTMTPR